MTATFSRTLDQARRCASALGLGPKVHVLLVNDNPASPSPVAKCIQESPQACFCVECASPSQAPSLLRGAPFDVCAVDSTAVKLSDPEVVHLLRAAVSPAPFVVLSGAIVADQSAPNAILAALQ